MAWPRSNTRIAQPDKGIQCSDDYRALPLVARQLAARSPRSVRSVSVLVVCVALLLLLEACGPQIASSSHPATSAMPTATRASAGSSAGSIPDAQTQQLVYDGDGLHIESMLWCDQFLVLASDRLDYDAGEIQSIKEYLTDDSATLPSSLQSATGGSCGADIELTNTGSSSIVVEQVGVKLLSSPVQNTYQYRLIDICSVAPNSDICVQGHGGGPECDTYSASIHLLAGQQGALYSDAPAPAYPDGCPNQMVISPDPSHAMTLNTSFSADSLEFSIALQLKVQTASGEQTLTLSQPSSQLIFAGGSQYTCYALQGTSFTVEFKSNDVLQWIDREPPTEHLCG